MADIPTRNMLAQLTHQLLGDASSPGEQLAAAQDLHRELTDIVSLTPISATERHGDDFQETRTEVGVAIAPYEAAMCLREHLRTRQFALGVKQALQEAKRRFPQDRLRVLYAGTGPFATLATLQLPYFAADEVGFTFLDIHDTSTLASQTLYNSLHALDYVDEWVTGDAARYEPSTGFHVIVTEVLQRALLREPQVQVTRHLSRHLIEGGLFVPEDIHLDLTVCDPRAIFLADDAKGNTDPTSPERIQLGSVFHLCGAQAWSLPEEGGRIPLGFITIPEVPDDEMTLNIFTRIRTFGDLWLNENDCSLNLVATADLQPHIRSGERLNVAYRIADEPGLEFERPQPTNAAALTATESQTTEMKARI
ncbi:hypothetical protein [Shimia ponticola]|uniref:hypothetical protein n=1 Tax=Shimia ponticola TaxID=2582893 RepID=UPI0011BEDE7B|nr:hypothetical protein [Shimia ponticola]